jgi:hypothetical protein
MAVAAPAVARRMRASRRLAVLLLTAGLVVMGIAPTAQADRAPTAAERTGIEQAAHREYGAPGVRIKVSGIEVSTTARPPPPSTSTMAPLDPELPG